MFSDLTICWQSKYIYNGDIQNRRHKPLGRNVKPDTITTRRHESRTKFASFRVPSRASCTLWKNKTNISISIKCEEPQETVPSNTMDGRKQTIKSQYLWPRGLSSACFARLLAAIPKRASDYSVSWTETIKTCVPNRQMNNSNVPQHWLDGMWTTVPCEIASFSRRVALLQLCSQASVSIVQDGGREESCVSYHGYRVSRLNGNNQIGYLNDCSVCLVILPRKSWI